MSLFTAISELIIKPLELIFEFIYSLAFVFTHNAGISIICLSIAVNILVLPLYRRADAMQEQARDIEAKLAPWVRHIKKNFSGDERFMILGTYYRQNHYRPTDALRGSVSLLLEVPFFMAAYQFLSNLAMLQGISFGPIQNLGSPDAMLVLGGISINVLPVAMTVINLISGYIYTKGFPAKAKVQLYGMALLFLVLLYDSPSGLVFYWTLNNVFSLGKNIFMKCRNPQKVLGWTCSALGMIGGILLFAFYPIPSPRRKLFVAGLMVLMQLPLLLYVIRNKTVGEKQIRQASGEDHLLFFLGAGLLSLVTGLLIPSAVLGNSPAEFVNQTVLINPASYLFHTMLIAAGTFLLWFGIFYMLASPSGKKTMGLGMWLISVLAIADYMFFGKNYGNLSPNLKFDVMPRPAISDQLLNLGILAVLAGLLILIFKKKREIVKAVYFAAILAVAGMAVAGIPNTYRAGEAQIAEIRHYQEDEPGITLSREGKNVIVIMMDRAVGLNIPYILQEKPELADQFRGFDYYPRTLSHGMNTNIGSPAMMGGYDYRPEQMNLRAEETLQEKHDEALRVMPVLFDRAGYQVNVWDPPLAGYFVKPSSELFAEYPNIHHTSVMHRYEQSDPNLPAFSAEKACRNLYCYGLFKISPVFMHHVLYSQGTYNDPDELYGIYMLKNQLVTENGQITKGISSAYGMDASFNSYFHELEILPELTEITDGQQNTFFYFANNVSHSAMMLQAPQYVPSMYVDNREYDAQHQDRFTYQGHTMIVEEDIQMSNYHSNIAYMIQLGKWMDYLREEGVYDNTRIIIAADHGREMGYFPGLLFPSKVTGDILHFNPVLLVKDFGSQKDFNMDLTFMTNADVPYLAVKDLIEDPINPFTGNPINMEPKNEPQIILDSYEHCKGGDACQYEPAEWFRVSGDMFDPDNWELLNGPDVLPEK